MSFTRANPLGWALYEALTSTQMNALDVDHANAIDGAAGGNYAPSSTIQFDGDVEWAGVRLPKLVSRNYKRVQPLIFSWGSNLNLYAGGGPGTINPWDCGDWDARHYDSSGTSMIYWRSSYVDVTPASDNPPNIWFECPNLIDKSTIIGMGCWISPLSGASLAEFPPSISLIRMNGTTGTGFAVAPGELEDSTSPVGSYRVPHVFETSGTISEAIDQTTYYNRRYAFRVFGESGNGAQASLEIHGIFLEFAVTELTPG